MKNYHFSGVALLITHYNRSSSLERLLQAFKGLNCTFDEIVVSDDGSLPVHIEALQALKNAYNFNLVLAQSNRGLGNNMNKGQDAVTAPLTLYVQEDFVPTERFPESFVDAVGILRTAPEFDFIRFYAYYNYPYLKPYKSGFSEMMYNIWYFKYRKIYFYSDHPHLRRSSFLTNFGRYAENVKGDRMEYLKCIEVLQKQPRALFFTEYTSLFTQVNSEAEPSTMSRSSWTQTDNPFVSAIRNVYRQIKYNFDLIMLDPQKGQERKG